MVIMVSTGGAVWMSVDERITGLEQPQISQASRRAR